MLDHFVHTHENQPLPTYQKLVGVFWFLRTPETKSPSRHDAEGARRWGIRGAGVNRRCFQTLPLALRFQDEDTAQPVRPARGLERLHHAFQAAMGWQR